MTMSRTWPIKAFAVVHLVCGVFKSYLESLQKRMGSQTPSVFIARDS